MAYEVPGLHVKITGDNSDLKKKIKELQGEVKSAAAAVETLRQKLKDLDEIGATGSATYKDYVNQLEDAEDKWYELTDQLEQYEQAQVQANQATEQSTEKIKLLGYSVETLAKRFFGFYAIIRMVKQALANFQEDNPTAYVSENISDLKQEVRDLGNNLVNFFSPFINSVVKPITWALEGWNLFFEKIVDLPKYSTIELKVSNLKADIKDISKYYQQINKELKQTLYLMSGFDELSIFSKNGQNETEKALQDQAEVEEYIKDLKGQIKDVDEEIYNVWKQYADELGISVSDYKRLYTVYQSNNGVEWQKAIQDLGINWNQAFESVTKFDGEGANAIALLEQERGILTDELNKAVDLLREIKNKIGSNGKREDALVKTRGPAVVGYTGSSGAYYDNYNSGLILYERDFTTPYVPNAAGGVYTSPTMGLVAEYAGANSNPEIVTPQDLMMETFLQAQGPLADVVAQAASQVVAAISNKDLSVSIGDDVIANSAARGNRAYYQMTGGYLI